METTSDPAMTREGQIHDNILETMGDTPLVRLNSVADEVAAQIIAKVEFFNPGGSVKDRIGMAIIEDYERSGELQPGGTVVEATSGNTGVGLAIAAALKGYKSVFVMPDKMSDEKIRLLRAFGARVVITPTAVEPEDPRSYYNVAHQIVAETPNAVLANQYHNPVNPQVHYETTGPELWEQTGGKIDAFVVGMGTGGTITGVARYLKEQNPDVQIVGVDPIGSILYDMFYKGEAGEAFGYRVEGIGEDFVPSNYDFDVIDDMVRVDDRESFLMARRLVREEGIFAGGSAGSAVAGAIKYAKMKKLGADAMVVVLLPDSGSRYLSKVFNDDWMRENGYFAQMGACDDATAADVLRAKAASEIISVSMDDGMRHVIGLMKQHDISQAPVLTETGELIGIVRELDLLNHMLMQEHDHGADTISGIVQREVPRVAPDAPLNGLMSHFSGGDDVVLVVPSNGASTAVSGILTKIDILDYVATNCM